MKVGADILPKIFRGKGCTGKKRKMYSLLLPPVFITQNVCLYLNDW